MRLFFILILTVGFGKMSFSQEKTVTVTIAQNQNVSEKIRVLYMDDFNKNTKPAAMLNGQFYGAFHPNLIGSSDFDSLNPSDIKELNISKSDTIINQEIYKGTIYITLKDSVSKKTEKITLKELSDKHLKESIKNKIYVLNGKLLNVDETNYWVDPSTIRLIEVEKSKMPSDQTNPVYLILISTKKYLESKPIMLRGSEEKLIVQNSK